LNNIKLEEYFINCILWIKISWKSYLWKFKKYFFKDPFSFP